ncbi:unnamed protein product [Rotaria socialis]|uniref:Uncharacterized protein n=1 Tax=Rotaria socialis TaxID=392032 RepID=A0A817W7X3_9BILA|nr:unnamed protein product [Rotaria socialis]CAF4571685.1 unnamed protein product [Rotaria socialis]
MMTNNKFYHYQRIRSLEKIDQIDHVNHNQVNLNESSTDEHNVCAAQPFNIDIPKILSNSDSNPQQNSSATITTIDITRFISSWERTSRKDEHHHYDNNSPELNSFQITFTIPYEIQKESIYNKTVYIIDATHNQLLASITDICINESSFIINYSTTKPLPHNICLYLVLNVTSLMTLRDIVFCRTIDDSYMSPSPSNISETGHVVGPSQFFILSQCIIIFIMMFIIYAVQTARQKSLVNRVGQRFIRSRPYIAVFGSRPSVHVQNNTGSVSADPATTLESGLNHLIFQCHLSSLVNHQLPAPIEEQILSATDLTSTSYDRRATRTLLSRDLINVKEFTKRMSTANESFNDTEL